MKFPSWSEFDRKTSNLEKEIDENVRSFKNNHPLLDRALKQSFSFLPTPFNTYAQTIYDTFAGSAEDKSSQVLDYINTVKSKGEGYYNSKRWVEDYDRRIGDLYKQWEIATFGQSELNSAMTWFNKGLEFANLGKNANAIAYFEKAIEINPRFVEAWNNAGVILQRGGNYKMAREYYDKALNINPNFILAQRNKEELLNEGKKEPITTTTADPEADLKVADEKLKKNPNDAMALVEKGLWLYNIAQSNPSIESKRRILLESMTLLTKASSINMAFQSQAQKVAREYLNIDRLISEKKKKDIGIQGGLIGHYLSGSTKSKKNKVLYIRRKTSL